MRPYRLRIRLSSRRLNVTRLGEGPAATVRAAARLSLGSVSSDIELMRVSCHLTYMAAPTDLRRKRRRCLCQRPTPGIQPEAQRHGIVSGIHNTAPLPPIDRPSGLRKDDSALARSFRYRIPQPPAPRGRRDRACSQDSLSPYWANESWSFSF